MSQRPWTVSLIHVLTFQKCFVPQRIIIISLEIKNCLALCWLWRNSGLGSKGMSIHWSCGQTKNLRCVQSAERLHPRQTQWAQILNIFRFTLSSCNVLEEEVNSHDYVSPPTALICSAQLEMEKQILGPSTHFPGSSACPPSFSFCSGQFTVESLSFIQTFLPSAMVYMYNLTVVKDFGGHL